MGLLMKFLNALQLLVFFGCFWLNVAVVAAEDQPILRINNGMHTAKIHAISTDAMNQYMLSVSEDKTARLWSLSDAQLLYTLHLPQGSGDEGKLYAGAVSPDGNVLAVAGLINESIYLINRQNGSLFKLIQGLPNAVTHLSFSPDGEYLVAALGNGGIRVYKTADYAEVFADTEYAGACYWAEFDHKHRLVSSAADGLVRLYAADWKLIGKQSVAGGSKPYGVSFSPDGEKIAVGFLDAPRVQVLSAQDLLLLTTPALSEIKNGALSRVAWSADGQILYAGGTVNERGKHVIIAWANAGQGTAENFPVAGSPITALHALHNGHLLYAMTHPGWGKLTAKGQLVQQQQGQLANFRGKENDFLVSATAQRVQFNFEKGTQRPAQFDLATRQLLMDESKFAALAPADYNSLNITDWRENAPKLNGTPLPLKENELVRSLAIAADKQSFLLGSEWYLHLFAADGSERWKIEVPAGAYKVNISADGKLALAAFGDGTIRWYRMQDGEELLALYAHPDGKRWILWMPSGYYDAAPGAEDLIGWHVNRGKDKLADFFSVARFRQQFYRPDVIANILTTQLKTKALSLANTEIEKPPVEKTLASLLPPVITINSPANNTTFSQPTVEIRYAVRNSSADPVTGVKVLLDGRPYDLSTARGAARVGQGQQDSVLLKLPPQDVEVTLIAQNSQADSEPSRVKLRWQGEVSEEFIIKPKLYVLAVGNSLYKDEKMNLEYAAKDATDFTTVIQQQNGGLYRDVEVKLLTNADKDSVLAGLEWLEKQVTAKDVAMLFMAGHGVNDRNNEYYFLPINADPESLKSTAIPYYSIKTTITNLPGKVLYFLDTCHSGNVMGKRRGLSDVNNIINDLTAAENGIVVFTASSGSQFSLENPDWQNGAFTKALLEGLSGKADYTHKGKITINMLDLYLSERVKELTRGEQTPTTTKPQTIIDYPIVLTHS